MADQLGSDYSIIEEGLSARTTTADDPTDPRLNASTYLPAALATHLPLDLAIIMLGTNDTKSYLGRSAFDIGIGMSVLVGQVLAAAGGIGTLYPAPKVLIVAPPPLARIDDAWFEMTFAGGREKTIELARVYEALATFMGVEFLDAGSVIRTEGIDGIHFTEKNNLDLGIALARRVRHILEAADPGPATEHADA